MLTTLSGANREQYFTPAGKIATVPAWYFCFNRLLTISPDTMKTISSKSCCNGTPPSP